MGMLARIRDYAAGPKARFARELGAIYREELRLGRQLRLHAERVPYPAHAGDLGRVAERGDARAAELAAVLRALIGEANPWEGGEPRAGRSHWERLTTDLADVDGLRRRYRDLITHWHAAQPETAAILERLAGDAGSTAAVLRALIARSDPHAID